jgi:hypothetical protein
MSFTFQGKNIQDFYKSGPITVIPKFLTTEKAPTNEFEKNFPSRIVINGKDINEQAISPYYDNATNIPCTGYKHFSAYGQGGYGGSGGNGGYSNYGKTCKASNRGYGAGGGLGAKFGILKYPLNGANTININIGTNGNNGGNSNDGKECKKYGGTGGKGGAGNATSIIINGTTIVSGNGGDGGNGGNAGTTKSNGNSGNAGGAGNTFLISGARDAKSSVPEPASKSNNPQVRIYLHSEN